MAIDIDNPRQLNKVPVIGEDGTKLGTVSAVYYDNNTDRPAWVAVRTGLFGTHVSLVPLAAAELRGEQLHVPFGKQQLKTAPHHDPGLELSPQDEMDLFAHYGLPYGDPSPRPDEASRGRQASGPVSGEAMTRSEEQLRVRTESQPATRVRLRKHIVTEYQQVTVPVRREEIRLERESTAGPGPAAPADLARAGGAPADDAAADGAAPPLTGPEIGAEVSDRVRSDDEHVVTLYEERPVVRTETVPVERVHLGKQTVTEQQTVGGQVRREEIELDTDPDVHDTR
jgi:stress response protein YsnF